MVSGVEDESCAAKSREREIKGFRSQEEIKCFVFFLHKLNQMETYSVGQPRSGAESDEPRGACRKENRPRGVFGSSTQKGGRLSQTRCHGVHDYAL